LEPNSFVAGLGIPAGSTLSYADDGSFYAPTNGLIQNIHMFDTTQDDLNNLLMILKLAKVR
jgi:hypothetical protein